MKGQPLRLHLCCLLLLSAVAVPAQAQDLAKTLRRLADVEADAAALAQVPLRRSQLRSATHVEERLTDGELFFRLQDYVRASVIFTDIVDNHKKHRAYPDALFLLAESLFHAGDYLGARAHFRQVIAGAQVPAYRAYIARSLGRLIEIAIHIQNFDGVDGYFDQLSRLPPSEVQAATNYFRAKYLYSLAIQRAESVEGDVEGAAVDVARLEQARAAFEAVGANSPYYKQARYFLGVIAILRGQLPQAAELFGGMLRTRPKDEQQRRIQDLAKLAVGRLRYELRELDQAIAAYQAVPRTSPLFDTALYEIAWVYIRMGDSTRAERALEVLSVAVPDSRHIPDGKVLRGNLLLRNGRFGVSNEVFADVVAQFSPVQAELDRMIARHDDPQLYFRQLVRQNLEVFDLAAFLPPRALRWTETGGEMERAMEALEDMATTGRLVRETETVVVRLRGALSAPNPVNVFRDLRGHREKTTGLRNRLARVRRDLNAVDAKATSSVASAELSALRARRRELERSLGGLPTDRDDMHARAQRVIALFTVLEKELSKLDVELLGMEARITASRRFISDTMGGRDPAAVDGVESELETHEAAVASYRAAIAKLRVDTEAGRLQVGVGDDDFEREASLRAQHTQTLAKERALLAKLGARTDPRVDAALQRVSAAEATLDAHDRKVDAVVSERVGEMRQVLDEEGAKLQVYRTRLAELQGESEDVVGGIAYANFRKVQKRFYDLVLRGDVGVIDVAWAVREEHRTRAEMLTRERTRALQALDDEFRDIVGEGEQ